MHVREFDTSRWFKAPANGCEPVNSNGLVYCGSVVVGALMFDGTEWAVKFTTGETVEGFAHEDEAVEWAGRWLVNEQAHRAMGFA